MNYHMTMEGPVPFTEQEEIEWAAEQAAYALANARAHVPKSITLRQCKAALIILDMTDDVEAFLNGMGDTTEGKLARNEWINSSVVFRDWPLVTAMSSVLQMTETQIDDLFIWANTL